MSGGGGGRGTEVGRGGVTLMARRGKSTTSAGEGILARRRRSSILCVRGDWERVQVPRNIYSGSQGALHVAKVVFSVQTFLNNATAAVSSSRALPVFARLRELG